MLQQLGAEAGYGSQGTEERAGRDGRISNLAYKGSKAESQAQASIRGLYHISNLASPMQKEILNMKV